MHHQRHVTRALRRGSRWLGSAVVVAALASVAVPAEAVATSTAGAPVRAFSGSSWFNTPLPADAPRHGDSSRIIDYLQATNVEDGCVLLSGAGDDRWGTPTYWATGADPHYQVRATEYALPPEFADLRIPRGARPSDNGDAELTVFDRERGWVAWLHDAVYDVTTDRWSADGGSIAYLHSNGLHEALPGADEPRNTGTHRGLNGAVVAARYDEVSAGAIEHVLRVGVKLASPHAVFPMTGSDGRSSDAAAPAQGTRLRIRPDVDLSRFGLHPEARVIAEALQTYGAIVGDSTGAPVELKLEDTVREGRGQLWSVGKYDLCSLSLDLFEVIAPGYVPPATATPVAAFGSACPTVTTAANGDAGGGMHAAAIACLAEWGVISRDASGAFDHSGSVTRAVMAAWIDRLVTLADVGAGSTGDRFVDDDGNVHEASIERVAALGIVAGVGPGRFAPDTVLTRAQAATFLSRTYRVVTGVELAAGTDRFVDDDGDAHEASIDAGAAAGLISGLGGGYFGPGQDVRRDQMASLLARLLDRLVASGDVGADRG